MVRGVYVPSPFACHRRTAQEVRRHMAAKNLGSCEAEAGQCAGDMLDVCSAGLPLGRFLNSLDN